MTTRDYPVLVHIGTTVSAPTVPLEYRTPGLDVTVLEYEKMTVAEARAFVSLARERPLEGSVRTIVLCVPSMSEAVQNTLLKILEEPPATTQIHIITPKVGQLLPTVRSRVQVVGEASTVGTVSSEVLQWLRAPVAERIQTVAKWHKQEDSDPGVEVLQVVGEWLVQQAESAATDLRATYQYVDSWYQQPGASRKMLLEELALQLPKITNIS